MDRRFVFRMICLAALIFAVVGYIALPDVVVMQRGFSGEVTNTLPKWAALAIPFVITVVGAFSFRSSVLRERQQRSIVIVAAGISLSLIMLFFQ